MLATKTKKDRTQQMYEDIRTKYRELSDIKSHGVQKYSHDYIVITLANKFYRSPKTIENIIFNRV